MLENINKKITEIEENLRKRREFSDILEQKQQELSKAQTGRRELSKAPTPPSSKLTFSSKASVVGLLILVYICPVAFKSNISAK